jgi:hypothetical protein
MSKSSSNSKILVIGLGQLAMHRLTNIIIIVMISTWPCEPFT